MNKHKQDPEIFAGAQRPPFWKGSTYKEPTWVSLAWIVAPLITATVAIYFVLG
jgi:hypothetical protein